MGKLVLRYKFDPSYFDSSLDRDDFGRLSMEVTTDDFTGCGGFWVQWQEIQKFGERLSEYPIKQEKPISAEWGYLTPDGQKHVVLGISIGPRNSLGELTVSVEIADEYDPTRLVKTTFKSGYGALDVFKRDIARMMDNQSDEAVLRRT